MELLDSRKMEEHLTGLSQLKQGGSVGDATFRDINRQKT